MKLTCWYFFFLHFHWYTVLQIHTYEAFMGAALFNGDISAWNVSAVTSMESSKYTPWKQLSLPVWNGQLTGWYFFFLHFHWLTVLQIHTYKVFGKENGGTMVFNGDISKWDVSAVTSLQSGMYWSHDIVFHVCFIFIDSYLFNFNWNFALSLDSFFQLN